MFTRALVFSDACGSRYDDLRPDLSAYDVPFMKTPSIQKLADTGVTFTRAYVQEAVCSPSRNSFTTGRRPNSTKVRSAAGVFQGTNYQLFAPIFISSLP